MNESEIKVGNDALLVTLYSDEDDRSDLLSEG